MREQAREIINSREISDEQKIEELQSLGFELENMIDIILDVGE